MGFFEIKMSIFREDAASIIADFQVLSVKLEFGDASFCKGRKTGEPRIEIEPGLRWWETSDLTK